MMKVLCVMMTCMVVPLMPYTVAMTCNNVFDRLRPCLNYLNRGGAVPQVCCNGVKGLIGDTKTADDRKLACNCVKISYNIFAGINHDNGASLPGKCGVNIAYARPNTDCNKYDKLTRFFIYFYKPTCLQRFEVYETDQLKA